MNTSGVRHLLSHTDFTRQLSLYGKIYNLPCITNRINVSHYVYSQLYSKNIVLSVLVNDKDEIFYRNSHDLRYKEIVGGYAVESSIEQSVINVTLRESNLMIDELRPLCLVKNVLLHDGQTTIQYGVAFLASTRSCNEENTCGEFSSIVPDNLIDLDKNIVQLATNSLRKHPFITTVNEVDEARSLGIKYIVHSALVKPIGKISSSVKLRRFLHKAIYGKSVLDVSSGDDSFIIEYAKANKSSSVVANDVAWASIEKLIRASRGTKNILFTNHDIFSLPYKYKFDTILFKNTLHHIPKSDQSKALNILSAISDQRLIIMDVESPFIGSFCHKAWGNYYKHFLRDQGKEFLTRAEFVSTITNNFPARNYLVEFTCVFTFRGNYLVAIIDRKK